MFEGRILPILLSSLVFIQFQQVRRSDTLYIIPPFSKIYLIMNGGENEIEREEKENWNLCLHPYGNTCDSDFCLGYASLLSGEQSLYDKIPEVSLDIEVLLAGVTLERRIACQAV